jgi:hypothetical protein
MPYKNTLMNAAENAHLHALAAARRAIRAGDIVLAERWMRLAERHYRCAEHAQRQAYKWRKFVADFDAHGKARRAAARAQYQKQQALEAAQREKAAAALRNGEGE